MAENINQLQVPWPDVLKESYSICWSPCELVQFGTHIKSFPFFCEKLNYCSFYFSNFPYSFCWVLRGWGEREGVEWVVREGVGAGGRNDPSLVCTYE
jgi:hypothetical protein